MRSSPAERASRWRALGRLLPREVRERIFEPSFSDLLYRWLTDETARGRVPFGLYALGIMAGCIPIAVPRLFVREGALTRVGWVAVAGLMLLAVAILVLQYWTRSAEAYLTLGS